MNRFRMTAAALGLLTAGLVPSMRADDNNKETRMTINGPLQVQDTLLAPGQYVFKLIEPGVVSIHNADRTRPEGIIMGWPAYRINAGEKKVFTVSEAQGNQPATLKFWFYQGDNSGLEFSAEKLASETGSVVRSKKKGPATDAGESAPSTP